MRQGLYIKLTFVQNDSKYHNQFLVCNKIEADSIVKMFEHDIKIQYTVMNISFYDNNEIEGEVLIVYAAKL